MKLIHMPMISFVIWMGLLSVTVGNNFVLEENANTVEDWNKTVDIWEEKCEDAPVKPVDTWEDKCENALVNYFGSNHSKTIEIMSGVEALLHPNWKERNPLLHPNNTQYTSCGVTQMILNLIISRNLQNSSDSVIPKLQEILVSQSRSTSRFVQEKEENQTPEEQKEVIDSLKSKLFHQNKPVISACTLINSQDNSKDIGHTFVIHKTKPDSFRVYQSFIEQYDLYAWFTQNPEDRLKQTVTTPSELRGVLSNVTMTNFINKLEYLISGKASLNEILDYAKNGFWGSSHLNPPNSTFINIICENVENYRIEDDCQIGINNVEKKLREIEFIR